jgi:DNA-directed RNA polymerase subunit RPC12/RpoP
VSQIHTGTLSEYSCKLCGKQCKDDKALQKHLMIHDTTDNKCTICGKRFHSRARLKR